MKTLQSLEKVISTPLPKVSSPANFSFCHDDPFFLDTHRKAGDEAAVVSAAISTHPILDLGLKAVSCPPSHVGHQNDAHFLVLLLSLSP